jgi:hypothetical protein
MEQALMERDSAKKQLQELNQKHIKTTMQLKNTRAQLTMQIKINQGHQMEIESQLDQQEALKSVSLVSEGMRKKFQEELRQSLASTE